MPDELKVGRLLRDFPAAEITIKREQGQPMALSFPASSEAPVERFFGTEILSHSPGAIRTQRIDARAVPLLFNHDWNDPIGMVDAARSRDGRLYVDAHLFDTQRAQEIQSMISGGLRNVSIGYQMHTVEEDAKRNTYTATDWEPLEVSVVTVPADPSVGIGRSEEGAINVRVIADKSKADTAAKGAKAMSEETKAPAAAAVEMKTADARSVEQIEHERVKAVRNMCEAAGVQSDIANKWIHDGTDWNVIADEILKIKKSRAEAAVTSGPTHLDLEKRELQRYSLLRAIRAAINKDWTKAGLELECNRELSRKLSRIPRSETSFFVPLDVMMRAGFASGRRDMDAAGVSGSNYLVSTTNQPGSFIDLLRNTSVGLRLGVTRMSGLVGNVTVPKMTAGNTAYWLSDEATQITESQPTLGQVSLSPKNVAALTELSHQLIQQSTPDAEQLVLNSIARDIALAVDVGIIRGTGANGQPHGIVGTSGVGAFTGTSLAAAGVLDAQTDVAAANALSMGCAYVTTPAVAALLMARPELPSTGTTRLWQGNMIDGSLFGFPAVASNQMASATALFGWWPSVVLGEWGVLELMTNPYSDFTRGLSAVRGWYTCDVAIRYAAAFSYSSSIT